MGNINNKKDYEINEYGEIVRSDISPKLDKIRGRITQPKPGNNPKKGNNYPAYILLILAILLIVGAVVIGLSNRDSSNVNTGNSSSYVDSTYVDSTSVDYLTPAADTFAIFKTNFIKKEVEGEQSCIIAVSYPIAGDEVLVSSVRKWINKALADITSISKYDYSMSDGDDLVEYYFNNITSSEESANWDIRISKEDETSETITYQATYSLSYSDGERIFDDVKRATFRKSNGEIID